MAERDKTAKTTKAAKEKTKKPAVVDSSDDETMDVDIVAEHRKKTKHGEDSRLNKAKRQNAARKDPVPSAPDQGLSHQTTSKCGQRLEDLSSPTASCEFYSLLWLPCFGFDTVI